MTSFEFEEGGAELLEACDTLWDLFVQDQTKDAGEMGEGIKAYIYSLRGGALVEKTKGGQLHVQIVRASTEQEPIGFCITSLTKERVGEVEILFVVDRYQGNKLGGQLFRNTLDWMEKAGAVEQKLVVATGNEKVFDFYAKYGFFPAYSTLFRAS